MPSVVNPFFEIPVWRRGARRKLVQLRVLGITSNEHVISACVSCSHESFRQRWGIDRVTLLSRHRVRMSTATRIIVGVTAPNSIGRWITIGFLHHQYQGLGHGCMPAGVTSLSSSNASNPGSIPRASCAAPCPSPTGVEYVDWRGGTNGQLYETHSTAHSWQVSLPVGSGALGSEPDVVVRAGGQRDVFWKGTNGKLTEMWYGGFWNGPIELKAAGHLRSAPAAVVDKRGVEHVFWKGANGWLWEISAPGRVWSSSFPVDSGRVGSAPTAVANAEGGEDVFWKGTGGKLWEIRNTAGWGAARQLPGAATIASEPIAVSDARGVDHVFWKGTNGWLWEISDPGGNWGASVPLNSGRLYSAPGALVQPGGEIDVFWKGSNGYLRELRSGTSGGWRNPVEISQSGRLGSRPSAAVGRCH